MIFGQMMFTWKFVALLLLISCWSVVSQSPDLAKCSVPALTDAGWVCGTIRRAAREQDYASFRGVPYAKQPLRELRFKELQPLERWSGYYNATSEGPVCPQYDVAYGRMMQPQSMCEECIHANIHVPLEYLPHYVGRPEGFNTTLPIVVLIHGGGFTSGSGDADVYGPEYLVSKKVIVITFNYRLNVFGFLSLNSSSIPGNNGLRDMVTLLRWVQRNAHAFGGNPDEVTLTGQSAGAVSAHLLSLSPATKGLFKRVWLMSGVGTAGFYTPSPAYAQYIGNLFLSGLGINSTDPEEIHAQLINTPIENIIATNQVLLDVTVLSTFVPVIESPFPGVTRILDDDPEVLVAKGRGKDIPLVIGFTNKECETFRPRFQQLDLISRIKMNPVLAVSPQLMFNRPTNTVERIAFLIQQQYFNGTVNLDNFIKLCCDQNFQYPAMKLVKMRTKTQSAPEYLYQFAYNNNSNVIRKALELNYNGAAHTEDMTYIFRVNSMLEPMSADANVSTEDWGVIDKMTSFFINFVQTSAPVPSYDTYIHTQPLVTDKPELMYKNIEGSKDCCYRKLTDQQKDANIFFDTIYNMETAV